MVDFQTPRLAPGTVAHVSPGGVQRWYQTPGFDATVILVRGHIVPHQLAFQLRRAARVELGTHARAVDELIRQLQENVSRSADDPETRALIVDIARLLLRYVAAAPHPNEAAPPALLSRFRLLIEPHFRESRSVEFYCEALATSTKFFARMTGLPPRRFRESL